MSSHSWTNCCYCLACCYIENSRFFLFSCVTFSAVLFFLFSYSPIIYYRHTGVVVYGNEYYFGGGIQHVPAGKSLYGTPVRVVDLGTTHLPKDVFESYLQEISHRYTEQTYSLLTHNCNNFSNEVAQFLVGSSIPDYILDLPKEVMNSPGGALFCE